MLEGRPLLLFLIDQGSFAIFLFGFRRLALGEFSEVSVIPLQYLKMLEMTHRDILVNLCLFRLLFATEALSKDVLGAKAFLGILHGVFVLPVIDCRRVERL